MDFLYFAFCRFCRLLQGHVCSCFSPEESIRQSTCTNSRKHSVCTLTCEKTNYDQFSANHKRSSSAQTQCVLINSTIDSTDSCCELYSRPYPRCRVHRVPWSVLYSERFDDRSHSADSCCDPYSCTQTNFRSEVYSLQKQSQKLRRSRDRFDPKYSDGNNDGTENSSPAETCSPYPCLGFVHTMPGRKQCR